MNLANGRWLLSTDTSYVENSHDTTVCNSSTNVVSDVPVIDATRAQQFKILMSVFTPVAFALADMPQSVCGMHAVGFVFGGKSAVWNVEGMTV